MTRVLLLGMGWFPDRSGGLNRYVRGLSDALEAPAVVLGPAAGAPERVAVAGGSDAPLPLRLARFAAAAARAGRSVEVVDAHFALYALLPLLGPLRRRRLVVHFHGPWGDEAAEERQSRARAAAKRTVERLVYRRADAAVTLSRAFADLLSERYGVPPERIAVVPPGVDLTRFAPGDRAEARRRLGLPEEGLVGVCARRLVPRMGLDVLLDAWREVDGTLLVVGDGPERAVLEASAPASVRFLGRVDDAALADAYRAADVSVVPSVALEGYGLVVLESLACGTPAVVTDVGGLPETVAELDPSLVVPAGDPRALAARLRAPLPPRAECRAHAERFSWSRAATAHEELFRRVAGRTPRVVYLDHTARLSGGELALARTLEALGDSVEAHAILGEDGPLADRLRALGVAVEILPLPARARELPRRRVGAGAAPAAAAVLSLAHALRLARRLRRLRPDLVHANSLKSCLYGGAAGRLARVPVLWHVRDRIADDYLPAGAVRLVRLAARVLPAAVVANSRGTLATVGRPGHVLPSPVDVAAHGRNGRAGPLRVGMLGRIAPWKGQDVFLRAFAAAFPHGEETAAVVGAPLFGADEERYESELRRLAERLGVSGRVEFRGFREDVPAELARLDVLVHASVLPEPFGQVVLEGMAAGLPVVATDAGGPAELVDPGVDGLLVPPADVEALAEALRRLAADPTLRARLGETARERARAFAADGVAARLLELYRSVGR